MVTDKHGELRSCRGAQTQRNGIIVFRPRLDLFQELNPFPDKLITVYLLLKYS